MCSNLTKPALTSTKAINVSTIFISEVNTACSKALYFVLVGAAPGRGGTDVLAERNAKVGPI